MAEFIGLFELLSRAENYQSLPWKGRGCVLTLEPVVGADEWPGWAGRVGWGGGWVVLPEGEGQGAITKGFPLEQDFIILQISKA